MLVNDLQNIVTWSQLGDDQYRVETSYIFLYIKSTSALLPPTPSLPFPQAVSTSQQHSSSDQEDILVSTSAIEKQVQKESKEDDQGRKMVLRNQKPSDPQYDGMWYIFLQRGERTKQWFAIPLIAVIKTLKEAKCDFKKPPPKKLRKNWRFEHFFREVFHAKAGKKSKG